jgi:hypothetical protein
MLLHSKIMELSIVVEHGVTKSYLMVESFQFTLEIFWENQWLTLFEPMNAYTR